MLASDRLVIAGSNGEALSISPYTGKLLGRIKAPGPILIPPIVAGDTLYFKVDDENRPAYVAAAAHPFTYRRRTRTIEMSYYHEPQPVMADPVEMADWAGNAHAAARRGRAVKRWRR